MLRFWKWMVCGLYMVLELREFMAMVVVHGGESGGDMVVSGGLKGCLDHWIQGSSPLLPPLQRFLPTLLLYLAATIMPPELYASHIAAHVTECITRSSIKGLLTPFEEPERCEEEVTEAMREPAMEEYLTKTREVYGSGIARPKIDEKSYFELKAIQGTVRCPQHYLTDMLEVILFYKGLDVPTRQILDSKGVIPSMKVVDAKKAIQDMADHSQKWNNGTSTRTRSTETSDGLAAIQAQLNNLGREIKKVNERVYREATPGFYQRDNRNPSYQERRQTMEESLSKFMVEYAKRHDENSNLIKEIRASTDAAIRNQGASFKALEIEIGQMSKVLQDRGSESLPSLTDKKTQCWIVY
ncbi:hypothetical protein Tco_0339987 [Tanacetum coccineum]